MISRYRESLIFTKLRKCEVSQKKNPRENSRIFSFFSSVYLFIQLSCLSLHPGDRLLRKGRPIGSPVFDVFLCFCYIPTMVSRLRCSTWLYRFIILAVFYSFLRNSVTHPPQGFNCFSTTNTVKTLLSPRRYFLDPRMLYVHHQWLHIMSHSLKRQTSILYCCYYNYILLHVQLLLLVLLLAFSWTAADSRHAFNVLDS